MTKFKALALAEYFASVDSATKWDGGVPNAYDCQEIESDNSSVIIEDIKSLMFYNENDCNYEFETWICDDYAFIIKDENGKEYRVQVTKEV